MSVLGAILVPHPPVILPQVGKGREHEIQATVDAYRAAALRAAEWKPEVLVIISPHSVAYADYFHLSPGSGAAGDMARFGAPQVRIEAQYDAKLVSEIMRLAQAAGIQAGTLGQRERELDHGTLVPLFFLREAGVNCPLVRVGLSGLGPSAHYRLGKCIAQAAGGLPRRTVVVASGDLSHKLTEDGPYGYAPQGPEFDRQATRAMAEGDFLRFLTFDPAFCDAAAECGLRSFQIMAGALDGLAVTPELLSYQGNFGVGYGVAVFTPAGTDGNRHFDEAYESRERQRLEARRSAEDPWVRLARLSLETYIRTGRRLGSLDEGLPPELTKRRAGTFVSLHRNGLLRGCIGTVAPATGSVAEEILRNAVSAGTEDPRFSPVGPEELDSLEYSVDVLEPAEAVSSPEELDVNRYGVIVTCGRRRGLLLPNLEGVDTVERQIAIARQKGGIGPEEPYRLERFQVVRHT